jgi:hypothetical protein
MGSAFRGWARVAPVGDKTMRVRSGLGGEPGGWASIHRERSPTWKWNYRSKVRWPACQTSSSDLVLEMFSSGFAPRTRNSAILPASTVP